MSNTTMTETLAGLGRYAFRTLTQNAAKAVTYDRMEREWKRDMKRLGLPATEANRKAWFEGAKAERAELA